MLKNNITSDCPAPETLLELDSSDRKWSGDFAYGDDGMMYREKPPLQNSWRLYDHDSEWRVFLFPPAGMAERIKMITITPGLETYFDRADKPILVNHTTTSKNVFDCIQSLPNKWNGTTCIRYATVETVTQTPARIVYHDRYVDAKCWEGVINAAKTDELIADTIFYMRSGCLTEHTSFNHIQIVPIPLMEHNITDTQDYKDKQWMEYVKTHCIYKFKECT